MTVAVDGVHPPSPPTIRALVVAGLASSVGKTTVTLALAAAYRRRGLRVRCAKVGPDFIDPGFHARATGAPSRTLDAWMLPPALLRTTFAQTGADADLVLVEGQMGLFDGLDGRQQGQGRPTWTRLPTTRTSRNSASTSRVSRAASGSGRRSRRDRSSCSSRSRTRTV